MYQSLDPYSSKRTFSRKMHMDESCLESFFLPDEIIKNRKKNASSKQPKKYQNYYSDIQYTMKYVIIEQFKPTDYLSGFKVILGLYFFRVKT